MGAAECSWTFLRLPPNRRRSATVVNTSADRRRCSCETTFPRAAKLIFASCRFTLDEHAATSAFIALFLTFFCNFSETYRRITGSSRKNSLRPFPNCTAFSAGLRNCRCPARERRAPGRDKFNDTTTPTARQFHLELGSICGAEENLTIYSTL